MTASDTPAPELADSRRAEVRWPLRVGVAPAQASEFSPRPEPAPNVAAPLVPGATVALVPSRTEGPANPDWKRLSGKTQLAVAAAETLWHSRQVELLMWVTATSRASVLTAYEEVAAAITGTTPLGPGEQVAARLLGWLAESSRSWLLVLDDLSPTADLRGLWPIGPAGRVLVTTADPATVNEATPRGTRAVPIGTFSSREALNYLMGRLSADPDRRLGAIDLVQELGCEPLALAQACSVINSSAWSCRDYQEAFVRRRGQMTDRSRGRAREPGGRAVRTGGPGLPGQLQRRGPAGPGQRGPDPADAGTSRPGHHRPDERGAPDQDEHRAGGKAGAVARVAAGRAAGGLAGRGTARLAGREPAGLHVQPVARGRRPALGGRVSPRADTGGRQPGQQPADRPGRRLLARPGLGQRTAARGRPPGHAGRRAEADRRVSRGRPHRRRGALGAVGAGPAGPHPGPGPPRRARGPARPGARPGRRGPAPGRGRGAGAAGGGHRAAVRPGQPGDAGGPGRAGRRLPGHRAAGRGRRPVPGH